MREVISSIGSGGAFAIIGAAYLIGFGGLVGFCSRKSERNQQQRVIEHLRTRLDEVGGTDAKGKEVRP